MPNGTDPSDLPGAWDQILFEARELRRKQDNRLAANQRQSQLVIAAFLAISAIVSAIVSSPDFEESGGVALALWVLLVTAVLHGVIWHFTNMLTRRWRETPDIDHLVHAFPDRGHGLVPLQRHLIRTFMFEFHDNERLVRRAQRAVTVQTATTLVALYYFAVISFEIL